MQQMHCFTSQHSNIQDKWQSKNTKIYRYRKMDWRQDDESVAVRGMVSVEERMGHMGSLCRVDVSAG